MATSWTPTLERCLEPGKRYAWSVRARWEAGAEGWSRPRLIEVQGKSAEQEFEEALKVVQRYLQQESRGSIAASALGDTRRSRPSRSRRNQRTEASTGSPEGGGPLSPDAVGLRATVSDTNGLALGVYGISMSSDADSAGVVGETTAASGSVAGVTGRASSPGGAGVRAAHQSPAGGADLILDGSAQGVADTILSESGVHVGGTSFDVGNATDNLNLTIDGKPVVATQSACSEGEIPKRVGGVWTCGPDLDADTDTLADLGCASGEIAKWNGTAWVCAADVDTDTLASLSCSSGEVAVWNGSSWLCQQSDGGSSADPPCVGSFTDTTQRFVDCGNGTVTDTTTGLIWLKDASCATLAGLSDEAEGTWSEVQQAVAALGDGECGLTDNSSDGDWRLPTRDEWRYMFLRAHELGCGSSISAELVNTAGTGCWTEGDPFTGVQRPPTSIGYFTGSTVDDDPASVHAFISLGQMTTVAKTAANYAAWPVRGLKDVDSQRLLLASDGPGSGLNADTVDGWDGIDLATDDEVFSLVLGSDGSASGLDADRLDGLQGSAYATDGELSSTLLAYPTAADLANPGAAAVHWNNLTAVPPGFADNDDGMTTVMQEIYSGTPADITTVFPTFTTVSARTVPAGHWLFIGGLQLVFGDAYDVNSNTFHEGGVYCRLALDTGLVLDFTNEGTPDSSCASPQSQCSFLQITQSVRRTVSFKGAAQLTAPTEVRLECAQSSSPPGCSGCAEATALAFPRTFVALEVEGISLF